MLFRYGVWTGDAVRRWRGVTAWIASVVLLYSMLQGARARAEPLRYELDGPEELAADGWRFEEFMAKSRFEDGQVRITTTLGFGYWQLEDGDHGGWLASDLGRGFWVEARMRVVEQTCLDKSGPGLQIGDGTTFLFMQVGSEAIHFGDAHASIPFVTTDALHVYRLESPQRGRYVVSVDGQQLAELTASPVPSSRLLFGGLGTCDQAESEWDYFAYDTFDSPDSALDADADGVTDGVDDCPLVRESQQSDQDEDGVGDACDPCPSDPENDADHDGLCETADSCPQDPRNDYNGDGECDTAQCAPLLSTATCPDFCPCPVSLDTWAPGTFDTPPSKSGVDDPDGCSVGSHGARAPTWLWWLIPTLGLRTRHRARRPTRSAAAD